MKRLAHISVFITVLLLFLGADNDTTRYNNLGGKIMCTCGCAEMLLKCDHVGCPNSDQMIRDLKANLLTQPKDEDVLQWFRDNWGAIAVVEPRTHGLDLLAWVLPPAALVLALGLVMMVARKWRLRPTQAAAADVALSPQLEAFRARARKDTEI
jgi:cytochrome c-type biogenesis protein CcmH/NrfF